MMQTTSDTIAVRELLHHITARPFPASLIEILRENVMEDMAYPNE